jgi:ketosteroid isomerase-like protein
VTQLTHPLDRRSGVDRRRSERWSPTTLMDASPIADWPLLLPQGLRDVRAIDPWARVVHLAILDALLGRDADASAKWEDAAAWHLAGFDPTVPGGRPEAGTMPRDAVGVEGVRGFHRELARLTDGTYRQELTSLESGRGPLVEAHLRTTARRGDRALDMPTLLVFELPSMRIRRVTEFPGDLPAWDAFWTP